MGRDYPHLWGLVDLINQLSPLQKKKLRAYLSEQDVEFRAFAEEVTVILKWYIASEGLGLEYLASSYLKMCQDIVREQVKFCRTGCYALASSDEAYRTVYCDRAKMQSYMVGLALSQFLWKNHYRMYRFFAQELQQYGSKVSSYLEIGAGHGLYVVEAVKRLRSARFEVVDISTMSLEMCQGIVELASGNQSNIRFTEMDILQYSNEDGRFDFVTIGEVIEHVEDPAAVLGKVRRLLSDQGVVFLTTCANCAAVDHVYVFHDVHEIRQMIGSCGFRIMSELVLEVDELGRGVDGGGVAGYNYAAVIGDERHA